MRTVVVLLSDKRSGSTMVQEELTRHSGINRVAYSSHTYHETHHWLKAAVLLKRPAELFSGGRIYEGYGSRANARQYMVDTIEGNIEGFSPPDDDERLVYEGWEALCERFATPVFFEKSPQLVGQWAALSLLLKWAGETSFDVKFIGLVRNPLAVQYSAQELFSTQAEQRQFSWLEGQLNLLAFSTLAPAGSFKLVRYEEVVRDPQAGLADLCDFIGVDMEPQIGSSVRASSVEKWRGDETYTLQLDPAVRQLALSLGYSEAELDNPNQPSGTDRGAAFGTGRRSVHWDRLRNRRLKPLVMRARRLLGGAR